MEPPASLSGSASSIGVPTRLSAKATFEVYWPGRPIRLLESLSSVTTALSVIGRPPPFSAAKTPWASMAALAVVGAAADDRPEAAAAALDPAAWSVVASALELEQ